MGADNKNVENDVGDDDTLQMAQVRLNVFVLLTTHFWKGANVLGQTKAGSNSACDWPRKGARETIQAVEIQKEAKAKMSWRGSERTQRRIANDELKLTSSSSRCEDIHKTATDRMR